MTLDATRQINPFFKKRRIHHTLKIVKFSNLLEFWGIQTFMIMINDY